MFPRKPDLHKVGKPLIPDGLGVVFVLFTTVYLFLLYFTGIAGPSNNISAPLTLAVCILFGGFMGLLDDWIDLKWRYKAFMPLIAALPLIHYAIENGLRTSIILPIIGVIQFNELYYFLIIPLIVMIVTNTINQLGGLNGLETICPAIILIGLAVLSPSFILMLGPILVWLILAFFNSKGKIFVGNTGSFAIGMTIASFAIITDLKSSLIFSIIPYVFNSALILFTIFIIQKRPHVIFDGKKLHSGHRRSLVTLVTYKRYLTERQVVTIISLIIAVFTIFSVLYFYPIIFS